METLFLACIVLCISQVTAGAKMSNNQHLNAHRKLTKHEIWMDKSLPLPHATHDLVHLPKPNKRHLTALNAEMTPLFPGYGTHFAYVYVGTPPQRQSVIIDTGSHYTAFPCTGCSQCGEHTDPYWNLINSSTAVIPKCFNNQPCQISQSYTEGSSWHAFKVVDKLWVGSSGMSLIPGADKYGVDFEFGCQSTETGLFRTQLADGIMGMSISDDTLPNQLQKQKVTNNRVFALCFRVGGGIMTLGGVDQRIHTKKTVRYAKLDNKSNGWFGVVVQEISLQTPKKAATPKRIAIAVDKAKYATGKGTIVDSGTTDTYLPTDIAAKFMETFKEISGVAFSSGNVKLSADQLAMLPTIVYTLSAAQGNGTIDVEMPWTSYVDNVGEGKYSFRVYLTEKTGAVLGANFMNGYNIVFDADGKRVGFAESACNYEEWAPVVTKSPTARPTTVVGEVVGPEPCIGDESVAFSACTAVCDKLDQFYTAQGTQDFVNKCKPNAAERLSLPCQISCNALKIVRGDPECPDKPWTECGAGCVTSRKVVPYGESSKVNGKCNYLTQTNGCYSGLCEIEDSDYLIYVDMRVHSISPSQWSYVHTEAFYQAMAALFKIKFTNVELLNDAGNEYTTATKLHFQIRLRAKDYTSKGKPSVMVLHNAAEHITEAIYAPEFKSRLINQLVSVTRIADGKTIDRFGWMIDSDIEVLNAAAVPMGVDRDPYAPPDNSLSLQTKANLALVGIALAAVAVLLFVLYANYKLRQQYALYEKDKGDLGQGGAALARMWNKFASIASRRGHLQQGSSLSSVSKARAATEIQMSNMGLLAEEDDEIFGEDA